jgi:uncharacterized protein YkwD
MGIRGCLGLLAVAITLQFGAVSTGGAAESYFSFAQRVTGSPPEGVVFRPDLESVLFSEAQNYRTGKRSAKLFRVEGVLQMAARAHALDLLQQGVMGHTSSQGYSFDSRMRALHPGVMVLGSLAENAARDRSKGPADEAKARRMFQQWIKSSSHRKTLGDRTYIRLATGVVQKDNVIYAVQIFAGPEVKTNMTTGGASEAVQGLY